MSIFDEVPDLTDFSSYGQPELKKNARPSIRHAPMGEIACRCSSKGNGKMVMCSFDWREKITLSLLDKDFSCVVIYPCSC